LRAASQLIDLPSPAPLATRRLTLYPACPEDLEARVAMDRDPQVMRYIRPIPEDVETSRAEVRGRILSAGQPGRWLWHVALADRPGFLGWCGLFALEDSGLIEIGYRFTQATWGQGVATEAARAVLDHGFRILKIDPIVAVTDPENLASQGVLRKIGLRREGTAFHYGHDLPFYRLTLADYRSPSTSLME
jgi:RimJ/RimL family protein N-acetyltransferase